MITIKDVATEAGVSIATASRALRNIGYISREVQEKVLDAAARLGYVPNSTAQRLKGVAGKSVGFIVSDTGNEYYWSVLSCLQKRLADADAKLTIAFSSENPEDEEKNFRLLIANRVSVILFIPTCDRNDGVIRLARQNGIRVIQLFRNVYRNLDTVLNDDEEGCRVATEYLLTACGCRRLILADVAYEYLDFERIKPNRSDGFLRVVSKKPDVEYRIAHLSVKRFDEKQVIDLIDGFRPDGIIAATNVSGADILRIFSRNPQKYGGIRLVVFDDNHWLDICAVSAVKQDTEQLVDSICERIFTGEEGTRRIVIPETLIPRGECRVGAPL